MDLIRGLAVTLVVLYHAAFLTETRGDLGVPAWIDSVNAVVAPFRMPVLVLLSGILLGPSLSKGWRRFFAGKLRNIAWPYLVWTGVMLVLFWPAPVLGYLRGATYLWFLLFLLLYFTAAWVLRPLPVPLVAAVAFAGAVLAPDDSKYGERLLYLFALFLVGHLVASAPRARAFLMGTPLSLVAGVVLLVLHGVVNGTGGGYGPLTLLGTAGGLLLLAPAARFTADRPWTRPLNFAGRHSLVFYVVHFPVILVTTTLATRVTGVSDGAVLAAVSAVVALSACVVLALVRDWPVVKWLFTFPLAAPARRRTASRA